MSDKTPTNTWTVTNAAGAELARVEGATSSEARIRAYMLPSVKASGEREGGFAIRRLLASELTTRVFVVSFTYEGTAYTAPVRVDEDNDTIKDVLCRALGLEADKTFVTDLA